MPTIEPRTDPETRRALHRYWDRPALLGGAIEAPVVRSLLADADALAGALADVERQRAIIRQARRHIEAILRQADAALMEMRNATGRAIGPGEGPLRGVRGNLLALYDDLGRAALGGPTGTDVPVGTALAPDGGTGEARIPPAPDHAATMPARRATTPAGGQEPPKSNSSATGNTIRLTPTFDCEGSDTDAD